MENYVPPFKLTNSILGYVSSIMESLGKINSFKNLSKFPLLRKENRVKSIQSSCAIEANSLSLEQVEDVINGHKVIGPKKDILEIINAFEAYKAAFKKDPFNELDLLDVHSIMTKDLVDRPGRYRKGAEGVVDGEGNVVFIAPPADLVPELMSNLLKWVKENFDSLNVLVLSSIFHYEFVFIHPFGDGNGRMARLWQNVILSKWKPIFEYIPLESLIKKHQEEYYEAIDSSNKQGESTIFIEFMLKMIDESIKDLIKETNLHIDNTNKYMTKMTKALSKNKWYSAREIQNLLGLSDRINFRKNYLDPAIKLGLVVLEYPSKPQSKLQRYKLV